MLYSASEGGKHVWSEFRPQPQKCESRTLTLLTPGTLINILRNQFLTSSTIIVS